MKNEMRKDTKSAHSLCKESHALTGNGTIAKARLKEKEGIGKERPRIVPT